MSDKKDIKDIKDVKDISVNKKIVDDVYEKYNYPSVDKLKKLLKIDGYDITAKEIKEILSKKQEVEQFKEVQKSKHKMGHITSVGPNLQIQADIYYMQKYHKSNRGYKYILACIDIFTRKLYCEPLRSKDVYDVIKAFDFIFKKLGYPFVLTSDSDSTFLSDECQAFFKKHNINHTTVPVGDHASLGLIDRVARTLKTILHKKFMIHKSTNWIDALPTIVENYNNTPHVAIDDITPNKANTDENISKIIDINNEKRDVITTFKNEFEPGDKVRIRLEGYYKKTEGQWSDEVYTVEKVIGKTVLLTDGKVKKYDMLLKVAPDSITIENPIKVAKKQYKQELIHKKEDIKEENIVREKRVRKPIDRLNL